MMRPVGWRYESARHSLAARGIRTGRSYAAVKFKDEGDRPFTLYHGTGVGGVIAREGLRASRNDKPYSYPDHWSAVQGIDFFPHKDESGRILKAYKYFSDEELKEAERFPGVVVRDDGGKAIGLAWGAAPDTAWGAKDIGVDYEDEYGVGSVRWHANRGDGRPDVVAFTVPRKRLVHDMMQAVEMPEKPGFVAGPKDVRVLSDKELMLKGFHRAPERFRSTPKNWVSLLVKNKKYIMPIERTNPVESLPEGWFAKKSSVSQEELQRWRKNVNMSAGEISTFMKKYGNVAGLSRLEASAEGIKSGRDSARAIIRMKHKPVAKWNAGDVAWMRRQNSFVARMRGARGPLYDDKGRPTRKLLALKVWGHDPEK